MSGQGRRGRDLIIFIPADAEMQYRGGGIGWVFWDFLGSYDDICDGISDALEAKFGRLS